MSNRELVVLGTASQVPTRRRNHNGYLLRWEADGILFDPGEGTQRQMLFAGVTASQIGRICITHFHGDHCLGLPGVLQRLSLDQVPHVVEAYYPAENRDVFERLRYAALYRDDSLRLEERPVGGDGMVSQTRPSAWRPGGCRTPCPPSGTGWRSRTGGGCCRTSSPRPGSPDRTSGDCSATAACGRSTAW